MLSTLIAPGRIAISIVVMIAIQFLTYLTDEDAGNRVENLQLNFVIYCVILPVFSLIAAFQCSVMFGDHSQPFKTRYWRTFFIVLFVLNVFGLLFTGMDVIYNS